MADVLHLVELVVELESSGFVVNAHQGVLLPSPGADLSVEEGEVPVVVDGYAVVHVVLEKIPCRHEISPAVGSVEALLLALNHSELGIALVDEGKGVLAGPLEGDSLDVLSDQRIGEDGVDECTVGPFDCSEVDVNVLFLHRGYEIVEEVGQTLCGPGT